MFDYEFDPWLSGVYGAQFLLSSVNATTQQQRLMIVLYNFYGFTCRFVAAKCATRNVFFAARTARCLRAVSFNCATKDDALKVCAAFNLALKSMPHKHVICVSCTLCRVRDVLATARACVYRWVCVYGCASTRRRK